MINSLNQLFFNLIHYYISQELEGKTCPLNYKEESAIYSIYNNLNNLNILKGLEELINQIKEVDYFSTQKEEIYVDQTPVFEKGVFKYNPLFEIAVFNENIRKEFLKKLKSLKINKKSRTLKVFLSNV